MASEQEMINRKRKFSEPQEEDLDNDLQLTLSLSFPPTTPPPPEKQPPPPLQEDEDHHNDLQLTLSLSFPPTIPPPPPPPPPEKQPSPPLQEEEDHHNDLQLTLSLSFPPTGTPPPPPPPPLQKEEDHVNDLQLTLSLFFPPATPPLPPPPPEKQPPLPTLSLPPSPLQQPPLSLSLTPPPRLQQKPVPTSLPPSLTPAPPTRPQHPRVPPSLTPSPPPAARLQQTKVRQQPPPPPPSSPLPPPTHFLCKSPLAPMRVSSCAIRNPHQKKSETVRAPFAWATTRRATVQSLDVLVSKEIFTITGDVQCKQCNSRYEIQYDLIEKFYELGNFIVKNKNTMFDRAPNKWLNPVLPKCKFCQELDNGVVQPVMAKKKRGINWLFLLLGQMIGCCTESQLKYFCKHTKNYQTFRTMDRLVYITYLGLCKQLDPNGPF